MVGVWADMASVKRIFQKYSRSSMVVGWVVVGLVVWEEEEVGEGLVRLVREGEDREGSIPMGPRFDFSIFPECGAVRRPGCWREGLWCCGC
jgi:hypothetical protein